MITKSFLIMSLILLMASGCTTYHIIPESNPCKGSRSSKIATYSYTFDDSVIGKKRYNDVISTTKEILGEIEYSKNLPSLSLKPHLSIHIEEGKVDRSQCGHMIYTALSFGIIPTWCTLEGVYKFSFYTYKNGNLVKKDEYRVDESMYQHLILLPVGLTQIGFTSDFEPIDKYKKALSRNIYMDCN